MNEYLLGVLITVSVVAAASSISYKGRGEISLRAAFMTLILYVALSPMGKISEKDGLFLDIDFNIGEFTEDYADVARDAFEDGVKILLCDRFSLDADEVEVNCQGFDFESMRAEHIGVLLSGGSARADRYAIEDYIEKEGLGECKVEIRIG